MSSLPSYTAPDIENGSQAECEELRTAVRVLGAVVGELAERVELLETRQAVADARNI